MLPWGIPLISQHCGDGIRHHHLVMPWYGSKELLDISSSNGLLPDSTEPSPVPMLPYHISKDWCKEDVTPVLTHWSYIFLPLTHPSETLWHSSWNNFVGSTQARHHHHNVFINHTFRFTMTSPWGPWFKTGSISTFLSHKQQFKLSKQPLPKVKIYQSQLLVHI